MCECVTQGEINGKQGLVPATYVAKRAASTSVDSTLTNTVSNITIPKSVSGGIQRGTTSVRVCVRARAGPVWGHVGP